MCLSPNMRSVTAILVLCAIGACRSAKLPSHFKRCDIKRENFDSCIQAAIEDVIPKLAKPVPKLGLPSIEPLEIPSIKIARSGGKVDIDQFYQNVKMHGFTAMKIDNVGFNFTKNVLHADLVIPRLQMLTDYEVSGQILFFPIQGTGPSEFVLNNLKVAIDLPFRDVVKNGRKHLKFEGVTMSMNSTLVFYQFDNLFNGDKPLGDNINNVLNDNWKEVFDDVKGGFEKAFGLIVEGLCNVVFGKVPAKDIFFNYE